MKTPTAALASLLCCGIALAAFAQTNGQPIKLALTEDKVGSEPVTFLPMVGDWAIVQDAGKHWDAVMTPARPSTQQGQAR